MIKQIIHDSISELGFKVIEDNERLLGGELDSMDFVNLIILIEEKVFEKTGKQITLVNDKAYSMRQNPFRDIKSMSEYIEKLIEKNNYL